MNEKYYLVSEEELIDLLEAYYKLIALESGGVDNWEWYSESLNNWLINNGAASEDFYDIAKYELDNYKVSD